MSDIKIIDFNLQKQHIDSFKEAMSQSPTKEVLDNGLYITMAFPPTERDYLHFDNDTIVSGVIDEEIFLGLPDINIFSIDEIFTFQEAVNKTIELQYDKLKGKGQYKKDYSKFQSEKFKGNDYFSPEPLEFNKFSEVIEGMSKPLSSSSEEENRDALATTLPNTIKMLFYNNEYLNNLHTIVSEKNWVTNADNDQVAKFLASKESSFEKYLNNNSGDKTVEFLSKVLKNSATNKGAVEKETEEKYADTSMEDLIVAHIDNISGSDSSRDAFKQTRNLIDKRFKEEFKLKELENTSTVTKLKEYNRLKDASEIYIDVFEKACNAKEVYFKDSNDKKGQKEVEKDRENVEYLKERFTKINDKCFNHLINGGDYKNEDTLDEMVNEQVEKQLDPDMPEGLKDLIRKAVGSRTEKVQCDCPLCLYETSIDTLATL